MKEKESGALSILSFVLGLIGAVFSFVIFGIVLCIVSLIIGIIALMQENKKGFAIGGIACSFLGILICLMMISVVFGSSETTEKVSNETITADTQTVVTGSEYVKPDTDEEESSNQSIWAEEYTPINDFRYHVDEENHTITLIKYDRGPESDISKILLSPIYTLNGEDYALVSMGSDACFFGKTWIESVIIPEGVTYIEGSCFNSCGVTDIYLPSTLEAIPDSLFSYLGGEYKVYCNSKVELPSERDTNDYDLRTYGASGAEELGGAFAGAVNGFFKGLGEDVDNPTIVNIYFGGTDEQWNNLTNSQSSEITEDNSNSEDGSYDLYDEGKQAGDKLSETLSNIDW